MAKKNTYKSGKVFVGEGYAGRLEEREGLYIFTYNKEYLKQTDATPVSLTLPLREAPYEQKTMIPYQCAPQNTAQI